jgi:putative ABC transport system substrate-binding protein
MIVLEQTTSRGRTLNRRRAVAVVLGAAVAPAAVARSQGRLPTIGFLHGADRRSFERRINYFLAGLAESGFSEGRNVAIEYRFAENNRDRLLPLAEDLVRRAVDVIVAAGGDYVAATVKSLTAKIPIVFHMSGNPVTAGLVESLARPGRNATGVTFVATDLLDKRMELLVEIAPRTRRMVAVLNSRGLGGGTAKTVADQLQAAARGLTLQLEIVNVAEADEIDPAFAAAARFDSAAVIVMADPLYLVERSRFADAASRHAVPACYNARDFPAAGGLMSYGVSPAETYRLTGTYAGRILGGAKAADLPVLQPTRYELVINVKSARALGIKIPDTILYRADEVIE